ncbi:MAG: hypothetical protein ACO1NZ_08800 [Adhaeribacter sp.]
MKKLLIFQAVVFMALSLEGCFPKYYSPNAHNVPLLRHKGETTGSISVGGGEVVNLGVDAQASTALTNHFALMGNFYAAGGKDTGGSARGSFFELGGGYYSPFAPKLFKTSNTMEGFLKPSLIFSAFGGGGLGTVINYYDEEKIKSSRSKFTRVFVQPAIGLKTSYLEAALSLRLANLHYYSTRKRDGMTGYQGRAMDFFGENSIFLWEPGLTVRGGWDYIKLQAQLGLSFNQTDSNFSQEKYHLNLGVYFDLIHNKRQGEK